MIEKEPFLEWITATGGESTQYLWKQRWLQVLTLKKDSTHENNRSRQVAPWNNGGTTQMHGCMCSFEVTIRLKWKYLSKHCLYTIHGCKCCSEINTVSYKEWVYSEGIFGTAASLIPNFLKYFMVKNTLMSLLFQKYYCLFL